MTRPTYSPEGYQYWYASEDDQNPYLMYDGQNFPNVAEINVYKERMARRKANEAAAPYDADTPGMGYPVLTEDAVRRILKPFYDATTDELRWFMPSQEEIYALQNTGMKRNVINNKIQQYSRGYYPDGWFGSAVQKKREPWR